MSFLKKDKVKDDFKDRVAECISYEDILAENEMRMREAGFIKLTNHDGIVIRINVEHIGYYCKSFHKNYDSKSYLALKTDTDDTGWWLRETPEEIDKLIGF